MSRYLNCFVILYRRLERELDEIAQGFQELHSTSNVTGGDQVKKRETGGACGMYRRQERCIQDFGAETWGRLTNLDYPDVKGMIILKCSRKRMGARTGVIWFRTGTSGELSWTRQWTLGIYKLQGISGPADKPLADQGLCCMKLAQEVSTPEVGSVRRSWQWMKYLYERTGHVTEISQKNDYPLANKRWWQTPALRYESTGYGWPWSSSYRGP